VGGSIDTLTTYLYFPWDCTSRRGEVALERGKDSTELTTLRGASSFCCHGFVAGSRRSGGGMVTVDNGCKSAPPEEGVDALDRSLGGESAHTRKTIAVTHEDPPLSVYASKYCLALCKHQ